MPDRRHPERVDGEQLLEAGRLHRAARIAVIRPASGWRYRRSSASACRTAGSAAAVALDCALRFESPLNSRPSMVCLCRASCFCRLLSSCRCCQSSRRLRRLINGRRHAGTATASCRAIISHRITACQLTPRKLRFCAWRAATGVLGISIQSQVITGTTATGTISAGLAFTAVGTMAAASALAGRGRRSGRSGIAADQAIA
jgi:hypothetical protein